jgi:outer membrane protein
MKDNSDHMRRKLFLVAAIGLILSGIAAFGQESGGELKLSLKEAQNYALNNNKMVKSARLTVEASQADVWSTIASGLPQISASAGYTDNFKLGVFFLTMNNTPTIIQMGSTYSIPMNMQASLPLFNAPYYVGIETVKLAQKLAASNLQNTEIDNRQSVASAYYLILVSEESLRILRDNLANLQETLKSTKAMYATGMAEASDVDQMASNVTMVENSFSNLQSTIEVNYNLLRFQLGVKADTKIILTETLDNLVKDIDVQTLLSQNFNPANNIQYDLMDKQVQMSALNLKAQKARVLPMLSSVYSATRSGMGNKLSEMLWFSSSYLGAQLSIPIFASGQRYSNIHKAKIDLEKAMNTKEMVTDQLTMQEKQLKFNLQNANMQYISQKGNVEVSKRLYSSMENKYKQGMASSLELTQANQLFLQSENNYISSLLNLLQTKLAFDKLVNNLQ